MRGTLRVVSGHDGPEVEVERSSITIGSSEACDLTVNDPTVSRMHAELQVTERGFRLIDLQSTNGTYLGSVRIGEIFLEPGTRFRVGQAEIEFVASAEDRVEILLSERDSFGKVLGRSLRMREIFYLLERFASKDVTILLVGETGTGKSLLAQGLHDESPRRGAPFVTVDCGAIAPNLIESELFGHVKGAFTGATADRIGSFEAAHRGTIFLDEVGELPLDQQVKLLRVLESKELRRVGDNEVRHTDIRVIAATNRRLEDEVASDHFRKDLFYRLSVAQIQVPPLRDRREDIPWLAEAFLDNLADQANKPRTSLGMDALSVLMGHAWPGNVRELHNVIHRAWVLCDGEIGAAELLGAHATHANRSLPYSQAREVFEKAYVLDVLERHEHNVATAAQAAGIQRQSLYRLMKKHGIDPKSTSS